MPVSFVAGTAPSLSPNAFATSITGNAPAGLTNGDVLLAGVYHRATISTPAGWTQVAQTAVFEDYPGAGNVQQLTVFSKTAVTTADASAAFTFSQSSGTRMGVTYAAFRGAAIDTAATSTRSDVAPAFGTSNDITPPNLQSTAAGQGLACFASSIQAFAWSTTQAVQAPSGLTLWTSATATGDRIHGAYLISSAAGQGAGSAFRTNVNSDPEGENNGLGCVMVRLVDSSAGSVVSCRVAADGPLQQPALIGGSPSGARISATSPLGQPRLAGFHDFSGLVQGVSSRYYATIEGPFGVVRLPISSWQATARLANSSYLQCVVPACAPYVDQLNEAVSFSIIREAVLPGGATISYGMGTAPMDVPNIATGPRSQSATLSGYAPALPLPAAAGVALPLPQVRAVFSRSGGLMVRSSIDWLLRPGMQAVLDGVPFDVSYINYFVNPNDAFMDVGEQVGEVP